MAPALIAERYIVGTPSVGTEPVTPDTSPLIGPAEDVSATEGAVYYDIKCLAKTPQTGGELGMFLNIEAQERFNPGYWLPTRGIYYVSRMMSDQYGIFLRHSDYGGLLHAVSVWICTNPALEFANTITRFSMKPEALFGNASYPRACYDLLTVVMVCLGKAPEDDAQTPRVVKLLRNLMDARTKRASKEEFLRQEFPDFPLDNEIKEGMDEMGSLSQGIYDSGFNSGVDRGRAEGRSEGRAEGILMTLFSLVSDKILTPIQGAERANISLEDFNSRYDTFVSQAAN